MEKISVFAVPGVQNILTQEQKKKDFIENLNVKVPVKISERKFVEMWPIFAEVCELYHENPVEVYRKNKKRDRELCEPRQLTMYLIERRLKRINPAAFPLRVIGGFFGKDHATAIHGIKTIENLLQGKDFKTFTKKLFE